MENEISFKEQIRNESWSEFNGPELYSAELIPVALIATLELESGDLANEVWDRVVNAIGNNHQGVYYPVVLKALDYLIEIERKTQYEVSKNCVRAILSDIYYFEPYIEGYNCCSDDELKGLSSIN